MPAEAIRYVNKIPAISLKGNIDSGLLTCSACDAEYRIHYSNAEIPRIADLRYLAGVRINAEHPQHERSILL
jgi:hypothetical protein